MAVVALSAWLTGMGIAGGLAAGAIAVGLARTIPQRMDLEPRPRPTWWWGAAVLTGGLYGWGVAAALETGAVLPAFLVFGSATLALALIDLDHQLIPNRVLFPALAAAAGLLAVGAVWDGAAADLVRSIGGSLAYFVALLAIGLLARGGFGMGDVKLALLLGLFLGFIGWGELALGAILAILLGGVASVVLLATRRKGRDSKFAYGPYLVAGAWVAVIWGEQIIDWYLS